MEAPREMWQFMVAGDSGGFAPLRQHLGDIEVMMVLVDSGAFDHVCPREFMSHIPVVPAKVPMNCHGPNGQPLVHYGHRDVVLRLVTGQRVQIRFKVMDLARPILSAMRLREKQVETVIGPQPYIQKNRRRVPLVVCKGLPYLPVTLANESSGWNCVVAAMQQEAEAQQPQLPCHKTPPLDDKKRWYPSLVFI